MFDWLQTKIDVRLKEYTKQKEWQTEIEKVVDERFKKYTEQMRQEAVSAVNSYLASSKFDATLQSAIQERIEAELRRLGLAGSKTLTDQIQSSVSRYFSEPKNADQIFSRLFEGLHQRDMHDRFEEMIEYESALAQRKSDQQIEALSENFRATIDHATSAAAKIFQLELRNIETDILKKIRTTSDNLVQSKIESVRRGTEFNLEKIVRKSLAEHLNEIYPQRPRTGSNKYLARELGISVRAVKRKRALHEFDEAYD